MFDEIDRRYFERRAREARDREHAARDTSIAQVHGSFAEEYERRAGIASQAVLGH